MMVSCMGIARNSLFADPLPGSGVNIQDDPRSLEARHTKLKIISTPTPPLRCLHYLVTSNMLGNKLNLPEPCAATLSKEDKVR